MGTIQYYKLQNGEIYALDKDANKAEQLQALPPGAGAITWTAPGMPNELSSALGRPATPLPAAVYATPPAPAVTPPGSLSNTMIQNNVPQGPQNTPVAPPVVDAPAPKPTTPTPAPTGGAFDLSQSVFGQAMNEIRTKLSSNNDLSEQKRKLLQQLYDRPLTPEELKTLSPSQVTAIMSGNRKLVETEVRMVTDEITGRKGTLDSSINYITGLYKDEQSRVDQQKKEAEATILKFVQTYGTNAGTAMRSIYGDERIKQLKAMGFDVDAMAKGLPPTIAESKNTLQYGTGGLMNPVVTLPEGTIAFRTNNPLNIKFSDTTAGFGGTDSGIEGQDGGTFAAFGSPEQGLQAAVKLLQSEIYSGLTVDEAMKKWSNNGYGAEVSPSTAPSAQIDTLPEGDLLQLVTDMAKRESGADVAFPESDSQLQGKALIDGTLIPSQLAFNARAKAIAEAKRIDPKYNAADAQLKFEAAKRWITGMNSQRMIQYQGLAGAVVNTIDEVKNLAAELKNSGITPLNKLKIETYMNAFGNTPEGQLAARYVAAVNTLKEEFANLANGGYAPTESAWGLANSQINGNYGVDQLTSSLNEIQRLINFRVQAIGNVQPVYPGSNNFAPDATGGNKPGLDTFITDN